MIEGKNKLPAVVEKELKNSKIYNSVKFKFHNFNI